MADEVVPGAAATPAPSPAPPPAPSPAPSAPATPATDATAAVPQPWSLRSHLSERLGNPEIAAKFADDKSLADNIAPMLMQAAAWRQQAELGQRYTQHAPQFEKWLADQEAAQKAKAATEKKWWEPPEFQREWEQGVVVDPQTGELAAKPGYDPTLPSKIQRYREFQRQKLNEFLTDPIGTIKPGLEGTVKEIVESAIKEHLGGFQTKQAATEFVRSNADWLFASDPVSKAPVLDPTTGTRQLTPAGVRFKQHVMALEQAGVTDIAMQQKLAQQLTAGDLLQLAYQQPGTTLPPGLPTGVVPPSVTPPARPNALIDAATQPESNLSLRDRLLEAFNRDGVTDETIRNGR